jgi:ribonucleoside-diphosphate reductase alpha chain
VIEGQTFYLTCGEYSDGRLGEIFIDSSKTGTFVQGVMGALARMASIALQCGADVDEVIHALKGLNFPPNGLARSDHVTWEIQSVADWIAQVIGEKYISSVAPPLGQQEQPEGTNHVVHPTA